MTREIDLNAVRETVEMAASVLEGLPIMIQEKGAEACEELGPVFSLTTVALQEAAYDLRDWIEDHQSDTAGGKPPTA